MIEVIAVLVILGILSMYAVQKYYSLQEESRRISAKQAISEVQARASMIYGKKIARNGVATVADIEASCQAYSWGDYTVLTTHTNSYLSINITEVQGKTLSTPVTGTWILPN